MEVNVVPLSSWTSLSQCHTGSKLLVGINDQTWDWSWLDCYLLHHKEWNLFENPYQVSPYSDPSSHESNIDNDSSGLFYYIERFNPLWLSPWVNVNMHFFSFSSQRLIRKDAYSIVKMLYMAFVFIAALQVGRNGHENLQLYGEEKNHTAPIEKNRARGRGPGILLFFHWYDHWLGVMWKHFSHFLNYISDKFYLCSSSAWINNH